MNKYPFGYLAHKVAYKIPGCQVIPVDQFDQGKASIEAKTRSDGFIYPQAGKHLHRLPVSHDLKFDVSTGADQREDANLIIQLVGFLHGTWLQFGDWWFDARVPVRCDGQYMAHDVCEHFLGHGYQTWEAWPERAQKRFVNTLIMFNRAPAYWWDWERFAIEYMVFDAIYRTAVELDPAREVNGHGKRIVGLCQSLGLLVNATLSAEIADLRNDLLHETIWDKGRPCTATTGGGFMHGNHLRRLNQRLVLAILGYNNTFARSNWWTMGSVLFDLPKP